MKCFGVQDFKIAILRVAATAPSFGVNKFNLLGRPPAQGDLERLLEVTFDQDQRQLAYVAFEELKTAALIRPTFSDLASPENWVEITAAGRDALQRNVLDDLDEALITISPGLLPVRRGAWAALASNQPDSLRHSAHSGRELIDQVLKEGCSDHEIKQQPGYSPDSTSSSGVTRRMRLRSLMRKFRKQMSDSDLAIAEKACDLVEAVDNKLKAMAHSRTPPHPSDVKDALTTAEMALKRVLLG